VLEDQGREEGCLSSQEELLVEDRLLVEGRPLVEDRLLVEDRPLVEVESTYSEVGKHFVVAVYYGVDTLHLVEEVLLPAGQVQ